MRVLILGGDGFCGWPTALHLSARGCDIGIVDNLSRRDIDAELEVQSLTPIESLAARIETWGEVGGAGIDYFPLTLGRDYDELLELITGWRPDAVVHFAEQRAAPYSMKSSRHKRYTVRNNVCATHDVLAAIVESGRDVHLVHLGTMGVYGYGATAGAIPEGYLKVMIESGGGLVEREILHPVSPGSIYHMTKTQDQLLFQFYARNDSLRITDLHQGIVWGCQTEETRADPRLVNRFDYDGDYGTVLNRFLIQAALGHPLTIHGSGGQTRAFINIQDTVRCIALALSRPPATGERVKICNQMTECWRVRDLAGMVARLTGASVEFVANPRHEASENELAACNQTLISLGLEPITLEAGLMSDIVEIARAHADRADLSKIPSASTWNAERAAVLAAGDEEERLRAV
ncbi:MAG TPA: NAD-dependent epimerase/dehydratase family protein [Caulobacteraceae bacterium]|jgi:UDP-sulfoquinovose synthase|nr:NAD-dependent epimerase/dehydratase family protein [Caulobacteraceae bacterium]